MQSTQSIIIVYVLALSFCTQLHSVVAQNISITATSVPRQLPIQIQASITPSSGASITDVTLYYVVNYGEEQSMAMTSSSVGNFSNYSATIPASDSIKPGSMVRWYAKVTDSSGKIARDPPFTHDTDRQYHGTILSDPSFLTNTSLPVVEIYCKDGEKAPFSSVPATFYNKTKVPPQCSMLLNDEFYDNLSIRRKGASSLAWPKPKFKISAAGQGNLFKLAPGVKRVSKVDFNSEWAEPGENSFMRETAAWEALKQMGVDHLTSYQTVVRINGNYFGKFALGEDWSKSALEMNGYATKPESPLFKSESGEYSNLRWDIPADQVQYYYNQENQKLTNFSANTTAELVQFAVGLAGGLGASRTAYVFDSIQLPKTINYMAAMVLLLNQDRCTKNFEIYFDPGFEQWSMLPWDIEQSFGIDRGLGGQPAPDYCILDCEQWNSPLYCDRNHPQDLLVKTPWGLITTEVQNPTLSAAGGPHTSKATTGKNRKLLIVATNSTTTGVASNGAAEAGLSLPANSSIPADYDDNQTVKGPTPTGAPGTFNYLIDAILDIPRTRAMYVRRLRTLMDSFIGTGKLEDIITAEYHKIKDEAERDNAKWGNPGSPDRGYQQLITEQLPIRKDQLYNKYSVGGEIPLIPEAQVLSAAVAAISIAEVQSGGDGYVQVYNSDDKMAVDVSGWSLSGGGVSFTFISGTVIPPLDSLYVAATSVAQFKKRSSSPKAGEGLFVVGPLNGTVTGSASDIHIVA